MEPDNIVQGKAWIVISAHTSNRAKGEKPRCSGFPCPAICKPDILKREIEYHNVESYGRVRDQLPFCISLSTAQLRVPVIWGMVWSTKSSSLPLSARVLAIRVCHAHFQYFSSYNQSAICIIFCMCFQVSVQNTGYGIQKQLLLRYLLCIQFAQTDLCVHNLHVFFRSAAWHKSCTLLVPTPPSTLGLQSSAQLIVCNLPFRRKFEKIRSISLVTNKGNLKIWLQ